jgi:hypothetical protein
VTVCWRVRAVRFGESHDIWTRIFAKNWRIAR